MENITPSHEMPALLVFADIIESSTLSAYLGPIDYARQLIKFQSLFEDLGRKYFPKEEDETIAYSHVTARGDEGILFCVNNSISKNELVYKALEFVFELKGRLKSLIQKEGSGNQPARQIDLGAGIHYGPVVAMAELKRDRSGRVRSIISRLEGYMINYAKRVESCSRRGNFSRVFLSKEAAAALEGEAIILLKTFETMKGISEKEEVFEVRSAFFHHIPISTDLPEDEQFLGYINDLAENPEKIREPWLKSLIISVLESRFKMVKLGAQRKIYRSSLMKLIWNNLNEEDPIIFYIRAKDYEQKGRQTARIRYLKQIIDRYPEFIFARTKIVDAFWKISQEKGEKVEKVFARDIAWELLNKFPDYLTDSEKKFFGEISKKGKKATK